MRLVSGPRGWLPLSLAVALSTVIAGVAAAEVVEVRSLDQPTSLAVRWRFATGDDPAWAQPGFDDSGWVELQVPIPWGRQGYWGYEGIAWYRLHVRLSPELMAARAAGSELRLAVTLGKVQSAYELYAKGQLLGGVGALPPTPLEDYDRHRTYEIPPAAVDGEGHLMLALRVWQASGSGRLGGGPWEGPFRLGQIKDLVRISLLEELPELVLTCLFAMVGVYHLLLYRRRPELSEYLWFGVFALDMALHTFLRTQWRYLLTDRFLLLKKVEFLSAHLLGALGIGCFWRLLGRPIGRWLRAVQAAFVALALMGALTPGLDLDLRTLAWWQAAAGLVAVVALWFIAGEARRGNPEARTIAIGGLILLASAVSDILLDRSLIQAPRTVPFGFAAFVLSMAVSLANRFTRTYGEIDDLRKNLEQRVEHRTRELSEANAHLAQERTRAEEANRAKSAFLANMSHELRTPLNGVLGFAQLMDRRTGRDGEDRQHLGTILRSGEHLLGLINDVLSLSKIEAGRIALAEAPFDLAALLRGTADMLRVRAEAKDLWLRWEAAPGLPLAVVGDEGKLRQVLLNLLGNAVKFTEHGGVTLQARWSEGRASFDVEDTGPGIAPEELNQLFQPFVQTETGRQSKEGTGLGLALSRQIARLMGGDITCESEVGRGTRFRVEVALPAAPEAAQVAERGERRKVLGLLPGQPSWRVLVVDDLRDNRVLLSRLLGSVGFEVKEAASGEGAIAVWRDWQPQLIWMDKRMPGIDGLEATRRIREEERGRDSDRVRILALSASALEHERGEILSAGCDDFVPKPFREGVIFAKMAEHLGVRYVYEEPEVAAPAGPSAAAVTADRLAALPREWLAGLQRALATGNLEKASGLTRDLEPRDAQLAEELSAMIKAFQLDELEELLSAASKTGDAARTGVG